MPARSYAKAGKLLRQDPLAPAYYFFGPVDILKDEAVGGLADRAVDPAMRDFNLDVRSAAQLEPEAIETLCTTLPMMAERRLVVIRDIEAWSRRKKTREAMLRYLQHPSPDTVVILVQGAAEPRADAELSKRCETIEFEPLDGRTAATWLARRAEARGVTLEPEAAQLLLSATDGDLGWLAAEVDKLAGLADGTAIGVSTVEGLLGVRHGETPLDWCRAVLGNDPVRAVGMLPHLLEQPGASGVRLVSQLGTHFIGVALARTRYDRGARGRKLESDVFATIKQARLWGINWSETARDWSAWAAAWPAARARQALRLTLDADRALKSTTISDERGILTDLVLGLVKGGATGREPARVDESRRAGARVVVGLALALLGLGPALPSPSFALLRPPSTLLSAQSEPRLVAAVRLAQEGLGDSARAIAGRMLAATSPTDPLYPEVLFAVGVVASSTEDQRLYFQRVAVEHSRSAWADHALLRLAQLDFAAGDHDGVIRQVGRLLADYPGSPHRATAALWGSRSALERRDRALACQWADLGIQAAGPEIELRGQLEFQRERCRTVVAADTAPAAVPPPARPPAQATAPAPAPATGWFVQVAALRTRQAATSTSRAVERAGYRSVVVEDAGFLKVRAGPFRTRDEANTALARLRREIGGQPFVVEGGRD